MPHSRLAVVVTVTRRGAARGRVRQRRRAAAQPGARRMPAAEPRDGRAVRRAGSPGGSREAGREEDPDLRRGAARQHGDAEGRSAARHRRRARDRPRRTSRRSRSRLAELRRTRDVVLIDQRGTGRSSPLTCQAFKPRDDEAFDTDPLPRARQCVQELAAQGVDAAQYTTTAWIADLEAMRDALGYPRWNLWGGSYGSRVALEYLRRHPDAHPHGHARRRRAAVAGDLARRLAHARGGAAGDLRGLRRDPQRAAPRIPTAAASLARIERSSGPNGRDMDVADPRTARRRAPSRHVRRRAGRAAAAHVRAGNGEPAARNAGTRGAGRPRAAPRGHARRCPATSPSR